MDSKRCSTVVLSKDEMESMKYVQLASKKPETLSSGDSEQKTKEDDDERTPGPAAYYVEKYWMKQSIYRSAPKYSLTNRRYDRSYYQDYSPGPGAYAVGSCLKNKSPGYSFGIKHSETKNQFYVYNRD